MYSTNEEVKVFVAERFIRTLKNNTYKYVTSVPKNVYIDKLDNIINRYNNTYYSAIRMKPVDVKSSACIDFNNKNNKECPKFNVNDHTRISKYKNIFGKRLHFKLV